MRRDPNTCVRKFHSAKRDSSRHAIRGVTANLCVATKRRDHLQDLDHRAAAMATNNSISRRARKPLHRPRAQRRKCIHLPGLVTRHQQRGRRPKTSAMASVKASASQNSTAKALSMISRLTQSTTANRRATACCGPGVLLGRPIRAEGRSPTHRAPHISSMIWRVNWAARRRSWMLSAA